MRIPLFVLAFILGPVRTEVDFITGKPVLTHLQKYSTVGVLITWPFCLHIWFFWKKQVFLEGEPYGGYDHWFGWVPGTEQGIYMRTPGYRYDAELGMKWTWGYIGGHWD